MQLLQSDVRAKATSDPNNTYSTLLLLRLLLVFLFSGTETLFQFAGDFHNWFGCRWQDNIRERPEVVE